MKRHTFSHLILNFLLLAALSGCAGSMFQVKSDPNEAEVFVENPKTRERKMVGHTPLEISNSALRESVGPELFSGEYFDVIIEKKGFMSERKSIPATRFGTLVTLLQVKMKEGEGPKQATVASEILDRMHLAQKLAMKKEYERAQIELDKVISAHPDFARALSMRASIYYVQGKFADSVKWYEEALKIDPKLEDAVKMIAKAKAGRTPGNKAKESKDSGKSGGKE